MRIRDEILDILGKCEIHDNVLHLPNIQLSRAEYTAVNKVLETLGGKWNRKEQGHVFDHCPANDIDMVILTGEVLDKKKDFQFFPTPTSVAEHMCAIASITPDSKVLEPSCGKGNIADVIYLHNPAQLLGIELNADMQQFLVHKPYETRCGIDFLHFHEAGWDRIVMNPPFARQQEIDHVMHAYDLLAPGGILVSVMSTSPFFRTNQKSLDFQEFIHKTNATVENLPEGTFKESGTMVHTCIVRIQK